MIGLRCFIIDAALSATRRLLSQFFQNQCQVIPEFLDRRNVHLLIGRVYAAQRRSERNHVQLRILGQEQSTFETGMYGLYGGRDAIQLFISLHGNIEQRRFEIGFPAGIARRYG